MKISKNQEILHKILNEYINFCLYYGEKLDKDLISKLSKYNIYSFEIDDDYDYYL